MKKILAGLVIVGQLLSQFSCTKTIYSHQQVMQSYKTKNNVMRQFGPPDEKIKGKDFAEEWLYDADKASAFGKSKTKVKVNGTYYAHIDTLHTKTVNEFTAYLTYIKFAFDDEGNTIKYETSPGINFAEKKSNPVGTALIVVGAVGAMVAISVVAVDNSLKNWNPIPAY
jgi:hypothetical protein